MKSKKQIRSTVLSFVILAAVLTAAFFFIRGNSKLSAKNVNFIRKNGVITSVEVVAKYPYGDIRGSERIITKIEDENGNVIGEKAERKYEAYFSPIFTLSCDQDIESADDYLYVYEFIIGDDRIRIENGQLVD